MSELPPAPAPDRPTDRGRSTDTAVGMSVLLAALAIAIALLALWIINSTYAQYRGRTDLDMPDWFAINFDLSMKVVPLGILGGLCLLISAAFFASWTARANWVLRVGFIVEWWVA